MVGMECFLVWALVLQGANENVANESETQSLVEEPKGPETFQFTYIPQGKRDPFQPFEMKAEVSTRSENPLLNFEVGQFRLTGVLWGLSSPRAIVKDPDNRGHIIRRGSRIGRNRGRVMRILKDRVVVAEQYRDNLGKLVVREVSLELVTEEGAK